MQRSFVTALRCLLIFIAAAGVKRASTDPMQASDKPVLLFPAHSLQQGEDTTEALQFAINTSARNGYRLEITASPTPYVVGPLLFPSNSDIYIDDGVIIEARSGFRELDKLLNIIGSDNVRIEGQRGQCLFRMPKAEYESGEYRHCLTIEGASSVFITGISCNDSGGDGVYIGAGRRGYSQDITITDSIFDNNRRQGLSIISGSRILIRNCQFSNTNGTAPSDGVDIEPNGPLDRLDDISIEHSESVENVGNGLAVDVRKLGPTSRPVSIHIANHLSHENRGSGYYVSNEREGAVGASGEIVVSDSQTKLEGEYGAVANYYEAAGPTVIFNRLVVVNPNRKRTNCDQAAIAVKRGGGGKGPIGNIRFTEATIMAAPGIINRYFTYRDYSNIGFSKLFFVDPVLLIGASMQTGSVDDGGVLNIDIP